MKTKAEYIKPTLEIVHHEGELMQAATITQDPGDQGNNYGAKEAGLFAGDVEEVGNINMKSLWDD